MSVVGVGAGALVLGSGTSPLLARAAERGSMDPPESVDAAKLTVRLMLAGRPAEKAGPVRAGDVLHFRVRLDAQTGRARVAVSASPEGALSSVGCEDLARTPVRPGARLRVCDFKEVAGTKDVDVAVRVPREAEQVGVTAIAHLRDPAGVQWIRRTAEAKLLIDDKGFGDLKATDGLLPGPAAGQSPGEVPPDGVAAGESGPAGGEARGDGTALLADRAAWGVKPGGRRSTAGGDDDDPESIGATTGTGDTTGDTTGGDTRDLGDTSDADISADKPGTSGKQIPAAPASLPQRPDARPRTSSAGPTGPEPAQGSGAEQAGADQKAKPESPAAKPGSVPELAGGRPAESVAPPLLASPEAVVPSVGDRAVVGAEPGGREAEGAAAGGREVEGSAAGDGEVAGSAAGGREAGGSAAGEGKSHGKTGKTGKRHRAIRPEASRAMAGTDSGDARPDAVVAGPMPSLPHPAPGVPARPDQRLRPRSAYIAGPAHLPGPMPLVAPAWAPRAMPPMSTGVRLPLATPSAPVPSPAQVRGPVIAPGAGNAPSVKAAPRVQPYGGVPGQAGARGPIPGQAGTVIAGRVPGRAPGAVPGQGRAEAGVPGKGHSGTGAPGRSKVQGRGAVAGQSGAGRMLPGQVGTVPLPAGARPGAVRPRPGQAMGAPGGVAPGGVPGGVIPGGGAPGGVPGLVGPGGVPGAAVPGAAVPGSVPGIVPGGVPGGLPGGASGAGAPGAPGAGPRGAAGSAVPGGGTGAGAGVAPGAVLPGAVPGGGPQGSSAGAPPPQDPRPARQGLMADAGDDELEMVRGLPAAGAAVVILVGALWLQLRLRRRFAARKTGESKKL
ncbi:hypothetical protein ACWEN6_12460 [Sphaerisporangium sp. NPDC004334]